MALELELFDYQKETVEFALKNPYSIIALEMGLGKTACMIALKDRLPKDRCLIICPSYLMLTWKEEINKFLKNQVITIFKASKQFHFPLDSDFVITSYDLAAKNPIIFEWATMIGLDEATAIKEMKTKRTEAIHKHIFENSISRIHLMTGTPIKNRVQEFYSLMALCNYNPTIKESAFLKKFPDSITFADYFSFRKEFPIWVAHKFREIKVISWEGLKNEEELKKWLQGIYISKKSNLPAINYKNVWVSDIDDEDLLKLYDDGQEHARVDSNAKMESAKRKAPLTCEYVDGIISRGEVEGPVIIYTDHVDSCKHMAEHFKTTPITGQTPMDTRNKMKLDFQAGLIPVLVATVGSFSTGLTLTRSNFMVFNDYPWVPGDIAQAEFRINRTGQTRPCHVHRIFGSKQDEYIFNKVMSKKEVIDRLV